MTPAKCKPRGGAGIKAIPAKKKVKSEEDSADCREDAGIKKEKGASVADSDLTGKPQLIVNPHRLKRC